MLFEKFCHPHTVFKHPYRERFKSSSSMVQNLCFRDIQKLVASLAYSIIQVSILAYQKPLIETPYFLNCTFFVHSIAVGERAYICLLYTSDAADEEDSVDLGGRR